MISRSGNGRRQAPITNSAVTDVPSGAASKIGDVPLQARRVPCSGLQDPVDRLYAPGEPDKPVRFDGRVPSHGSPALGDLLAEPRQVRQARPARPVPSV